jgi:hypothetical protein
MQLITQVRHLIAKLPAWFKRKDPAQGGGDTGPVVAFLGGAVALVASALAMIGLGEGDVDRAVVNAGTPIKFGFGAIVAAVCLGAAISLARNRNPRTMLAVGGLVALGVGLSVIATAAIAGRSAKDRPRIAAHLERTAEGLRVKGTITAAGLKATDHVRVRIIGTSTHNRLAEAHIGHPRGDEAIAPCPLDPGEDVEGVAANAAGGVPEFKESCWRQLTYSARIGASPDGTVDVDLDTPLATGLYERVDIETLLVSDSRDEDEDLKQPRCDKNLERFGCVSLMIPPAARRPELDARWELPATSPPVLTVTAAMGDLTVDDRVVLSVRRVLPGGRWSRIYGASWAPDAAGEVSERISLPIAARGRPVCVIMRTLEASVEPRGERADGYGPCNRRSRGMSVELHGPPRR